MNTGKITIFLLLSIYFISCSESNQIENGFRISGTISGADDGFVYLQNSDDKNTLDSAKITDGKFYLEGIVETPEIYFIRVNQSNKHITLFLENSEIIINSHIDSLYSAKISGSKCQIELDDFYTQLKPYKQKLKSLYKSYYKAEKNEDELRMKEIDTEYEKVHNLQINHMKSFALTNPASVVASYISAHYLSNELDYSSLDTLYNSFLQEQTESKYTRKLKDRLSVLENVSIGKKAINVSQNDTAYQTVDLRSLEGKVVLIEFWASWCLSCREENKYLKTVYPDLKKKGFEVYGISLDNDRFKWIEAIHENQLPWINVSDLKGWQSETRKSYGVIQTPHNILLDRDGIIIAKDIYGNDLLEEVSKIL